MSALSPSRCGFPILVAAMHVITSSSCSHNPSDTPAQEILAVHQELLASHINSDANGVVSAEADSYVVVSQGEVFFPTRSDRLVQFGNYLESTTFDEYRDLMTPIVHVSEDGKTGWLITQARIVSTRRDQGGDSARVESIWAWVELYKKYDDRWLRVGEVSNRKPPSQ